MAESTEQCVFRGTGAAGGRACRSMGQPPRDPLALMRLLLTVPLSRHVEDLISSKAAGAQPIKIE